MPLTSSQIAKIRQKESELSDSLKRDQSVNYTEGWFFVTLNTRDAVPVLSVCTGDIRIHDGHPDAPRCKYSELGQRVMEAWKTVPEFHSGVAVDAFEAMPEHVHGLLYLKKGNREHLGLIMRGFMIACTHAYWEILGIDWRKEHPTGGRKTTAYKSVATPEYVDRDHTHSFRGPALFVHGYNDTEPITADEVEIKRAYIRDQARKRLIQGDSHECFRKYCHQHSRNWTTERVFHAIAADQALTYDPDRLKAAQQSILNRLNTDTTGIGLDYIGDKSLLAARKKLPLICHRADAKLFERQKEAVMTEAHNGAVIVSAFISPKEREIRDNLLKELLPVIEIMDNGFSERYKPSGKAFYAVAENRLVQITPWNYLYQKESTLTREICMVMNELSRVICGIADDWWKTH